MEMDTILMVEYQTEAWRCFSIQHPRLMSTQANKPIIGENVLNFINNALTEKARYSYLNEREWAKNPSKLPFRFALLLNYLSKN